MIAKVILRTTFLLAVPHPQYVEFQEIAKQKQTTVEELISEEFMTRITGAAQDGTPLALQREDHKRLVDSIEIINFK